MIAYEAVNTYRRWLESEKLPIIRGYYVEDVNQVELHPWERTGGRGAYLDLEGAGEETLAFIGEIPPGASLKPEKHMYEEFYYIVSGKGTASVWIEGRPKQSFAWQPGSLFSAPLNSWHQLYNTTDKPVRYLGVTGAPVWMNLFHSLDFIFNNDYVFKDRYPGDPDYFNGEGRMSEYMGQAVWETNFIKDVPNFDLTPLEKRGVKGTKLTNFVLAQNTMEGHSSEFAPGTYKKAHRHGAGATILILSGKGYSFMWPEGEPRKRFEWHEGSILVPPENWWHQHFVTVEKPARYMALRWMGKKYMYGKYWMMDQDIKKGGDQIEYADEDPEIRRTYEAELAKQGVKSRMPDSLYQKVK